MDNSSSLPTQRDRTSIPVDTDTHTSVSAAHLSRLSQIHLVKVWIPPARNDIVSRRNQSRIEYDMGDRSMVTKPARRWITRHTQDSCDKASASGNGRMAYHTAVASFRAFFQDTRLVRRERLLRVSRAHDPHRTIKVVLSLCGRTITRNTRPHMEFVIFLWRRRLFRRWPCCIVWGCCKCRGLSLLLDFPNTQSPIEGLRSVHPGLYGFSGVCICM